MKEITVSIEVEATMDKVWEYWTNPMHITQWNFASDDWCCPAAENDLRPSGKFSWRMEAKDGSIGFDFEGTYDEIAAKKSISYSMPDGRKVDIGFMQRDNGVQITEIFDVEEVNPEELQRAGWQSILGNFKKYVESD